MLQHHGVEVITCAVPPSASIEERAEVLAKVIEEQAKGRGVNMIGYVNTSNTDPMYRSGGRLTKLGNI